MPSPILRASLCSHGAYIPVEISNYTDVASCMLIYLPKLLLNPLKERH